MIEKDIVVIYHKRCPDGFGAAYAAWKKFGDSAAYIPSSYGDPVPEGLAGKEVYILDFSFEKPGEIERLAKETKRLVVLDHHVSAKERAEAAPEHIFDNERSGATIAWSFFHPDQPVPRFFKHLEDGDLYRFALPETERIFVYLIVQPDDFKAWDKIMSDLEDEQHRQELLATAARYEEFYEKLSDLAVEAAKKVKFEGYECLFGNSLPSITMRSHIANKLYKKMSPIALVVSAHPDGLGVSIRSDGSVDVSKIAEKFGGGGHAGSAGFFIPNGNPIPWEEIKS